MRKSDARRIAQSGKITWGELQETLKRAYRAGAANDKQSIVNRSFTKATSFNIMCRYAGKYTAAEFVNPKRHANWLGAQHILREFGHFWEGWRPEEKEVVKPSLHHQEAVEPSF